MGLKLHDVSPLAAMVTGKGGMGKLISQGVGGMIPAMIARDAQRQDAEQAAAAERAASVGNVGSAGNVGTVTKMKKGGMSASKRADGIAQRGKTRGRLV
jgi:hypothetical protein